MIDGLPGMVVSSESETLLVVGRVCQQSPTFACIAGDFVPEQIADARRGAADEDAG